MEEKNSDCMESNQSDEEIKKRKKLNQHFLNKRLWLVLCLGIFFLIVLPIALYFFSFSRNFFAFFLQRLPYPVAWVKDSGVVTSRELLSNLASVKIFYRSEDFAAQGLRIDFSTKEGKERLKLKEKDILDKLIEDAIVKKLAAERGILVTAEEAEKDIVEKIRVAGDSQTFALNLKQNYDWSVKDFRDKVVIPQLCLKKLLAWYQMNDPKAQEAKEKISKIKAELTADEKNFSELAKKYSEGESALSGGDLGWFRKEEMVNEVADKVFSMKAGEISEIIESSLGWHLVRLEEEREIEEAGKKIKEVKIRQIFLGKGNFLEWLMKEKSQFDVWIFIRDYFWDRDSSAVVFRDPSLRSKEAELRYKSEGDPSVR